MRRSIFGVGVSAFKCRNIAIMISILLLSSCAAYASYPMKVKDVRGKVITIKARPMRIVSLAPNNTEILFSLGLGSRVVGVTKYCNWPAAARKKTKVGDMTINTESVIALKPDLVLAHANLNAGVIPQLERLGLTVFAIDPKTISQVERDIRAIGRITGKPRTAAHVTKKMEAAVNAVKAQHKRKHAKKVLVVVQSSPLWAVGPKTFVDEMIGMIHAKNVAFDAKPGFVTFSRELAISRNPDVIIIDPKSDVNYFFKSPEWRNTSAVKNKRIYAINGDLLFREGPRLSEGLKEMAKRVN